MVPTGAEVFRDFIWDIVVLELELLSKVSPKVVCEVQTHFERLEAAVVDRSRPFVVSPLEFSVASLGFPKPGYGSESFGLVTTGRFEGL